MSGLLANLFGGQNGTPRSQIPPWTTVRSSLGYSFGAPFPWEQVSPDQITGSDVTPDVVLVAPRSDSRPAWFIVSDRGPWQGLAATDTSAMLRSTAAAQNARPAGIRKLQLAGVPAQILQLDRPGERIEILITSVGDSYLEGQLQVPMPNGYLHHFETMLATWSWS